MGQKTSKRTPLHSEAVDNDNTLILSSAPEIIKSFMIPKIKQMAGSYIIVDPSGSCFQTTENYLSENGYSVENLDLTNLEQSVAYNPFSYIENENDIRNITLSIRNCDTKTESDPFHWKEELLLIESLIGLAKNHFLKTDQNFLKITRLLRSEFCSQEGKSLLDEIYGRIEEETPEDISVSLYGIFKYCTVISKKTLMTISLNRLSFFEGNSSSLFQGEDQLHLDRIGDEKIALFIKTPSCSGEPSLISNMLLTQAFAVLRKRTNEHPLNPLKQNICFIINDFPNVGKIPNFADIILCSENKRISYIITAHSVDQIKATYEEDTDAILENIGSVFSLGKQVSPK